MTANSISFTDQRLSRKELRKLKDAQENNPISLSFDTLRLLTANQALPVDQIMFNASMTEELSYQQTVKVETNGFAPEMLGGETLMNKVGKRDFFKTQVIMLFSIASLGLLIGFFIAYLV